MNRYNNRDFFDLWDWAKELEEKRGTVVGAKELMELQDEEEALLDAGGFYSDTDYQMAIQSYKEKLDDLVLD